MRVIIETTALHYNSSQLIPPPIGTAQWAYIDQASALGRLPYIGPADTVLHKAKQDKKILLFSACHLISFLGMGK